MKSLNCPVKVFFSFKVMDNAGKLYSECEKSKFSFQLTSGPES